MKYKVEIDNNLGDELVVIRCNENSNQILKDSEIGKLIFESIKSEDEKENLSKLECFKDDKEYYLSPSDILFFETADNSIYAHTLSDMYKIKFKLYELETMLPSYFMRISKSSIVNINYIYSITKNITSSSIIEFNKSYKKVYVSRMYYKDLKNRLKERN